MGKSFDMNNVNCALLVVVLIVVVVCCMTKSNSSSTCVPVEGFYDRASRQARRARIAQRKADRQWDNDRQQNCTRQGKAAGTKYLWDGNKSCCVTQSSGYRNCR
jgi:hypothetical protein